MMMSGKEVRNQMATVENFNVTSSYTVAQVAHLTCKYDHHGIIWNCFQKDF